MLMSRLRTTDNGQRTECEDRARTLEQNSQKMCYCYKMASLKCLLRKAPCQMFRYFSLFFQMYPQPLLFNFYQLCIFIWLHLLGFSLYCVFSNVYSNHLPEKMHSNISYICLTHCVLSNVSWNFFHGKRNSNTGCICLTFSTVCFQMTPQIDVMRKKQSHTGCICLTFLHCPFSNVSLNCLHKRMCNYTDSICLTFLRCEFSNVSSSFLPLRM